MRPAVLCVLCTLLLACSGNGDDESERQSVERRCLRARDHLIDMRLRSAVGTGTAVPEGVAAQHRAALSAALGEDFAARCASNMSPRQLDCVMDADDTEAAARCGKPY